MDFDPDILTSCITAAEAANLAGVKVGTIYSWKSREILKPVTTDKAGRPLFRFIDVARAELATRDRARRNHQAAA